MENKVVITEEQAQEIERIKNEGIPVTWKKDGWCIERAEVLGNISFYRYTTALFSGYKTAEEVAVEKQRRWWEALPKGSLFLFSGHLFEYEGFDGEDESHPVIVRNYGNRSLDRIWSRSDVTLICHAEDRKDA